MADKPFLSLSGLSEVWAAIKSKFQEKLVSGTNIKTINNSSILGSGNINITSGVSGVKGDAEGSYRTGQVNLTKANLGLGNVENKSSATIRSEIEIGGRNLFPKSYYNDDRLATIENSLSGYGYILPVGSGDMVAQSKSLPAQNFPLSRTYTVSFYASATGATKLYFDIFPDTYGNDRSWDVDTTIRLYTASWTHTNSTGSQVVPFYTRFWRLSGSPNYEIKIWDIKIELGNKATTWTPAPEDLVQKSGDTMTGDLTISKTSPKLKFNFTNAPSAGSNQPIIHVDYKSTQNASMGVDPISIIGSDTTDGYNAGVRLGSSNGTTIVGAGESSTTFASKQGRWNDETLYLVSDADIKLYKNMTNEGDLGVGPFEAAGFVSTPVNRKLVAASGTRGGLKNIDLRTENLLLNSKHIPRTLPNALSPQWPPFTEDDFEGLCCSESAASWRENYLCTSVNPKLYSLSCKWITISLEAYSDAMTTDKDKFCIGFELRGGNSQSSSHDRIVEIGNFSFNTLEGDDLVNSKWCRLWVALEVPSTSTWTDLTARNWYRYFMSIKHVNAQSSGTTMYIRKPKIELGEFYSGWSAGALDNTRTVQLTQSQYDALPSAEKNDGTVYFITDGNSDDILVNDSVPIGAIQAYAGTTAPTGWIMCNGQAVSRSSYSELFATIGTTYGSGDGSTTFNVPDLRGRVTIGSGTGTATDATSHALGSKGGEEKHQLTVDELASHIHERSAAQSTSGGSIHSSLWDFTAGSGSQHSYEYTFTTGNDQPHNNLQPYLTTNYIIKAKDFRLGNSRFETVYQTAVATAEEELGGDLENLFDSKFETSFAEAAEILINQTIYSTTEKRIGTWIDGKPLYRKVLTGTSTSGQYGISVSSLSIDTPVKIDVSIKNTTGGDWVCGSYVQTSGSDSLNIYMTGNRSTVYFRAGSGYAYGAYRLMIEYTKTTDTV